MIIQSRRGRLALGLVSLAWVFLTCATGQSAAPPSSPIVVLQSASERLELIENTSRILELSRNLTPANRILTAKVNNTEILELIPLSPTQIQVSAKRTGVTQVNLWDENDRIYTVDVVVHGDVQELAMLLKSEYPDTALRVKAVKDGVLIGGVVDQGDQVPGIMELARQFYPNVLENIKVGGVHQVLLHVKVMEVSRTKLRALGFDWTFLSDSNLFSSSVSGLLGAVTKGVSGASPSAAASSGATFNFDVIEGSSAFFGVLEALRQDNLAKILAEPTLVTVSGRPALFKSGGEVPVLVPSGLGTVGVEYRSYGTQVDFVPIVLGNGRIRLEVRPRVSDIDTGRSIVQDGQTVYAFSTREVDTGVELAAGETLAIAGLVQNRVESRRIGLPVLGEMPYVGALFRRVEERANEVELLILVTPELVSAMGAHEVPPGGPGSGTTSPSNHELYLKGHIEVPNCNPPRAPQFLNPGMGQALPPGAILTPSGPGASIEAPLSPSASVGPPRPGSRPVSVSNTYSSNRPTAPKKLPGFRGKIGYDSVN